MSTKASGKSKNKKPLETTLGKAPSSIGVDPIDLSHLRKPIDTSIFGLRQVLQLYETATDEVRRYVTFECDVMYECRLCRTIFRSLANFILHKRNYCRESYNPNDHTNCRNNCQERELYITQDEIEDSVIPSSHEESPGTSSPTPPMLATAKSSHAKESTKTLTNVLRRLQRRQESSLITDQCLSEDLSNESKSSEQEEVASNIALEGISETTNGVFQTMLRNMMTEYKTDLMKTQVMEIHDILENNEAILDSDGKIIPSESEKNSNFMCTICNQKFSTKKTLTYHIKYKHNNTRLIYNCPECKEPFANAWSIYRHLYKIHRKTSAQVKRLRSQIHSSVIRRDEQPERKHSTLAKRDPVLVSNQQEKFNLENQQWMNDLEGDNDLQICGGCGRKFERKAALHSHSQFCSKRIAICNSLKENSVKKAQLDKPKLVKPVNNVNVDVAVKGSRRRKQLVSQKMCSVDYVKDKEIPPEDLCVYSKVPKPENTINKDNKKDTESETSNTIKESKEEEIACVEQLTEIEVERKTSDVVSKIGNKTCDDMQPDVHSVLSVEETEQRHSKIRNDDDDGVTYSPLPNEENLVEPKCDLNGETVTHVISDPIESSFQKNQLEKSILAKSVSDTNVDTTVKRSTRRKPYVSQKMFRVDYVEVKKIPSKVSFEDFKMTKHEKQVVTNSNGNQKDKQSDSANNESKVEEVGLIEQLNENEECNRECNDMPLENHTNLIMETFPCHSLTKASDSEDDDVIYMSPASEDDDVIYMSPASEESSIAFESLSNSNDESTEVVSNPIEKTIHTSNTKGAHEKKEENHEICLSPSETLNKFSDISGEITGQTNPKQSDKRKMEMQPECSKRAKLDNIQTENCLPGPTKVTLETKAAAFIDKEKHRCIPCHRTFKSDNSLMAHMSTHFNWYRYQCCRCSFISYSISKCARHLWEEHGVRDTARLKNAVFNIPHWKTVQNSTDFTLPHVKDEVVTDPLHKQKNAVNPVDGNLCKVEEKGVEMQMEVAEIKEGWPEDELSPSQSDVQGPLLRKMILEVIFGNQDNSVKESNAVTPTQEEAEVTYTPEKDKNALKVLECKLNTQKVYPGKAKQPRDASQMNAENKCDLLNKEKVVVNIDSEGNNNSLEDSEPKLNTPTVSEKLKDPAKVYQINLKKISKSPIHEQRGTITKLEDNSLKVSENNSNDQTINSRLSDDSTEDFRGFQNITKVVNQEVVENSTSPTVIRDNPRPVRNRVPTLHKDFLYDMAQTLKLKMATAKETNAVSSHKEDGAKKEKHKPFRTYIRDSKPKQLGLLPTSSTKKVSPGKNVEVVRDCLVQDRNMNLKDVKKYSTGEG